MKKKLMVALIGAIGMTGVVQAGVVYSEDFTATNGVAFDGATTPYNPYGIPVLQSWGSGLNARINVDRLQVDDGGATHAGLAFGNAVDGRFNWATASFAQAILDNGLQIAFDARTSNGGDFWSMGFGSYVGDPDGSAGYGAIYDSTDMDWGVRWENDRSITFLADGTTTADIIQTYAIGNYNWYHIDLDLQFTSFAAGSTVTAHSVVKDTSNTIVSDITDTFVLSGDNYFVWDISANEAGSEVLMDNLVVIPEPATIGMIGLMGGGILFIRRRFMM